jgi:hypothetical protein
MLLINETTGEIRSEGVARRTGSNLFSPTEYNNHTAAGNFDSPIANDKNVRVRLLGWSGSHNGFRHDRR